MIGLLTTLHVLVALVLILVVLLQNARGTDIAGAFGGMGSQTAFGPRGTTTFLTKTTVVLAATFMVTSLALAILSNRIRGGGGSILGGEKQGANPSPVAPPLPPAAPGAPGAIPQPTVKVIPPPKTATPAGQAAPQAAPNPPGTTAAPPSPPSPAEAAPPANPAPPPANPPSP